MAAGSSLYIGGLLLVPCLAVCVLAALNSDNFGMDISRDSATFPNSKYLLRFYAGMPKMSSNGKGRMELEGEKVSGFMFKDLLKVDERWTAVQLQNCGELFDAVQNDLANDLPLSKDADPMEKALAVSRTGLQKGVVFPISITNLVTYRTLFVWPIFEGFENPIVPTQFPIGAPPDPIRWTADNKLALANDLVTSASYLHRVDLAHFQFSLDEIYGGRQEENPKFLPSSFGNLTQYGEVVRVLGCTPGEMWQRVDDKFDLYQMGVLLSTISAPVANSCDRFESFRKWREPFGNEVGGHLLYGLSHEMRLAVEQSSCTIRGQLTMSMHWLNIARFSRPFLFGEDLMFTRKDGQKLGDDNKSRLHIFCTLALIGDETLRPHLSDASWYLTTDSVTAMLCTDVRKFLVPYSHSVAAILENEKEGTFCCCLWDKLVGVANQLLGMTWEWNGADGEKLQLRERIENYVTKVSEMLKTDFVNQIGITKDPSLIRALVEVHTFSVLFGDFLEYFQVDHLKSVLPGGGLSEAGKKEFADIPSKDKTFGPCLEILDKLCKSR
eukprot:GHVS01060753.1.p1 GENE.GHVS01060753.1~~GHVS01060753.1.p1  ORF type:complete len:553 (+),score=42.37 GHVS01060753.1:41-1699(+)